jgi:hypothetical protein
MTRDKTGRLSTSKFSILREKRTRGAFRGSLVIPASATLVSGDGLEEGDDIVVATNKSGSFLPVVFLADVGAVLVSSQIRERLSGLKGATYHHANWASDVARPPKEDYWGITLIGRCDYPNGLQGKGTGFVTNWDGSDFFLPERTLFFCCTNRAAEMMASSTRVSENLLFEPASDLF